MQAIILILLSITVVDAIAQEAGPPDQTLAAAGTSAIEEERYDEAIEILNELIKRHPFTKELYQLRILAHKKLGHTDLVNQDINTINNFAEGYSLDEIVGIN